VVVVKKRILAAPIAVLILMPSCAPTPTASNVGAFPARYREIARDYLRSTLLDPYSARDFQIATEPKSAQIHVAGTLTHETGWAVCYRGNAKNRMGAYTGVKEGVLLVRGDRVVASNEDPTHYDVRTNCRDTKYEPFSLS
jgi:hypothetical protein